MIRKFFLSAVLLTAVIIADAKPKGYMLYSPDKHIQAVVHTEGQMSLTILHNGVTVLSPSPIAMERTDGIVWGMDSRVIKDTFKEVDNTITAQYYRAASLDDRYNSLTLNMKGGWALEVRAYDDGVAYRFISYEKKPFEVRDEKAEFNFPSDATATVPYVSRGDDGDFNAQYQTSFENTYTVADLSELNPGRLAFLPLVVESSQDVKLCFTEVNLRDYPGMYLYNSDGGNHLVADFAPYPKDTYQGGHNNLQIRVTSREDYIARVSGSRAFPWRAIVVGNDVEIASSDMTYLLADDSEIEDTSWIKPGKVAWDWWNNWNIS